MVRDEVQDVVRDVVLGVVRDVVLDVVRDVARAYLWDEDDQLDEFRYVDVVCL